jgi:hypothetical protein
MAERPRPPVRGLPLRLAAALLAFGACLLTATAAHSGRASENMPSPEYLVKMAFLFNFAKFVEWPPDALPRHQDTLTLCVLGGDPFGSALDALRGKRAQERTIVVRRLTRLEEVASCQVVFVDRSAAPELSRPLARTALLGILTVGDTERFAENGGIIELTRVHDTIRFEVNLAAAQRAGLRISSKLLRLARRVIEED